MTVCASSSTAPSTQPVRRRPRCSTRTRSSGRFRPRRTASRPWSPFEARSRWRRPSRLQPRSSSPRSKRADMTVIAIGSVHGSPGVTSLAIDLARVAAAREGSRSVLVEADPDGGRLAARLDLAVRPGLTELAGAARVGIAADDLWRFAQGHGDVAVVVAHPAAEQVQAALRAAATHIGAALQRLGATVIVDVGRLRPGSPSLGLAGIADHLIVVSDNDVEAIVSLTHRAKLLQ